MLANRQVPFQEKLEECLEINGAMAAAIVDGASGMAVATVGDLGKCDIDLAAAGNNEVMRAELKLLKLLKLDDGVEDMLISLGDWYELIRPMTDKTGEGLFVYMALDRKKANLALARIKLRDVEQALSI
ncbi:hypothetical protein [Croceicoccus bisphenolivorans]|uniref:hypothetical protein n=1 Tax=Croceicoccus bisphenolivorans TaxID=1783232 RepID=UPI0008371835|nr:hypothetical protein [Croceicoccus bisphenolivorans]